MKASKIKTIDQAASISSSPEGDLDFGLGLGLGIGIGIGLGIGLGLDLRRRLGLGINLGLALSLAMSFPPPPCAAQGRDKPDSTAAVQSHDHPVGPVQYYDLVFPPGHPLAVIKWTTQEHKNGRTFPLQLSALARGTVRVPTNCPMALSLKYDAVEHIDLIDQFAHCRVVSIDASRLDFTDAHLGHLKNFSYLSNLNLGETLISDKGLLVLGAMPSLSHLSLSRNDITGTTFDSLVNLHHLYSLNLTGAPLKKGSLAALIPLLRNLRFLDLSGVGLTREDGPTLQTLDHIISLDLTNNVNWDDDCAKSLARLTALERLGTAGTKMTDRCLPTLSKMPSLKTIYIRPKDFWTTGKPRELRDGLEVVDVASKSNAAPEIFEPLH